MGMNKLKRTVGEIKCVVVGDGGVGKTSMLMSYTTGGIMMDYIPTCFDCYTADMKIKDRTYTMSLIDTAGQETYDRLRTLSYYDTDVFVVCFSVADHDSFENVKSKWVQELKQYRPNTPYILVGTQTDQRETTADGNSHVHNISVTQNKLPTKCVSAKKGKAAAKRLGAKQYLECSALIGEGVANVFSSALQTVVNPAKRKTSIWKGLISSFKSKRSNRRTTEKG